MYTNNAEETKSVHSFENKSRFWSELLRSFGAGILTILIVNAIFLVIIMFAFNNVSLGNQELVAGYQFCSFQALIWLILCLIPLVVLSVLQIIPESVLKHFHLSLMEIWVNTGNLILLVRFMLLLLSIIKTNVYKTHACYLLRNEIDDGTFLFPAISVLLDVMIRFT